MSYMDPHGITAICPGRRNHLEISWELDDSLQRVPVLLFTPRMDNTATHYHIELDEEAVERLLTWLTIHQASSESTE